MNLIKYIPRTQGPLTAILLLLVFTACSTSKQSVENTNSAAKPKTVSAERKRAQEKDSWLGTEIVAESVKRLSSRLDTNKSTNEKLNALLSGAFKSIGGDLNASYENKQAREMGKKIIINSQQEIISTLEKDEQRTSFKNYMLN
jgi:hypothetical protein